MASCYLAKCYLGKLLYGELLYGVMLLSLLKSYWEKLNCPNLKNVNQNFIISYLHVKSKLEMLRGHKVANVA